MTQEQGQSRLYGMCLCNRSPIRYACLLLHWKFSSESLHSNSQLSKWLLSKRLPLAGTNRPMTPEG